MKTVAQIREEFIRFFQDKYHTAVRSSPVIAFDDPTLMFTIAGMNQFKDVFMGTGNRSYKRAVNSQKCIRAGGKHNDLDEVGRDHYHHSFFEMLGNWSFGDYYKEEAIKYAWQLLTETWLLPKDKLYATVFSDDDEAYAIWENHTDIDPQHISRDGADTNFWSMGDTGPCGPCSEIHYDRGEEFCSQKHIEGHVCQVNGDCGRIIEVWNLVFMQYNRDKNGVLNPLPEKHVDTGMGLERIAMILQNTNSNYHIDSLKVLLEEIERITNVKYSADDRGTPHRVIADHIRALVFAICDGGLFSNEGRGYVLRRILRRASRFGSKLGMKQPFIYKLTKIVVDVYGSFYQELSKYQEHAKNLIKAEEESFLKTLHKGMDLFDKIIMDLKSKKENLISGEVAFKLYDTYGFPLDLTIQIAEENSFTVDKVGFKVEMEKQKENSRKTQKFTVSNKLDWEVLRSNIATKFIGYDQLEGEANIIKFSRKDNFFYLVPDNSFFYAESGGQISDRGKVIILDHIFDVCDVQKDGEYFVLKLVLKDSDFSKLIIDKNTTIKQLVDSNFRNNCRRHHSATHLLHAALKNTLGKHVAQSGSYVDDQILRFDFSHFEKLSSDIISKIEREVNEKIRENLDIITVEKTLQEAKQMNVTALFGEKYGEIVRIVSIGDYSAELCGGTHANKTGDIGYFTIVTETSLATGIRRLEAKCADNAIKFAIQNKAIVDSLKSKFACQEDDIINRLEKLQQSKKSLENQILEFKDRMANILMKSLLDKGEIFKDIELIISTVKAEDNHFLKSIAENLRNRKKNTIIMLGSNFGDKVGLVCAVTDDLKKRFQAGKLIKQSAKMVQGGGGGAAHIATAGGKDSSKLQEALNQLKISICDM